VAGDALSVAFVGQSVYFRQCALERPADGLEPTFIDFRYAAAPTPLRAKLAALDPDVVIVFRPEIVPAGLFEGLRATTIGYLTEPLPRADGVDHEDLRVRMWWLEQVDAANFDRIVSFDPLIADTAGSVLPVWRSLPIPVSDSLYLDVRPRSEPPRLLFLGRPTEHRETFLARVRRSYPIAHIGHGLYGEQLRRFLERADVQLNLHNNPYPSFENRVCIALAAAHLVISEQLSPEHELVPARDFLQARTPDELMQLIDGLANDRDAHIEVQRSGREQAERFRASRVYPKLVRAALEDVEAHGSARR
jgi:hypothetical protein